MAPCVSLTGRRNIAVNNHKKIDHFNIYFKVLLRVIQIAESALLVYVILSINILHFY